ncbi:kinase-like domain-containing protein [Lipomyces arxii]|uniref:kinase-like domain-containing protein n=1 Tax=Lipomyces arxii TaxID=56418 RepID=UPI0034CE87A6
MAVKRSNDFEGASPSSEPDALRRKLEEGEVLQVSRPASPSQSKAAGSHHSFYGCCFVKQEYEELGKLGEGTFGEVYKARHRPTGRLVALKKILMHNEKEGFPITALREIRILKMLSHKNVIPLLEMAIERAVWDKNTKRRGQIYMVTPYMDHDLKGLLQNPSVSFSIAQIKCYMIQLLEGTKYLHDTRILHRDMKAANLLIDNYGILKIADFGLARKFEEDPPLAGNKSTAPAKREYTKYVVTRWYRPPELLLGERRYTCAIDMWGVGCIFGEMYRREPILAGNSDIDQLQKVFELCGSPNQETMPGWDRLPDAGSFTFRQFPRTLEQRFDDMGPQGVSLLADLLTMDPIARVSAVNALSHPFFSTRPYPAKSHELPTYNASHEYDRHRQARDYPPQVRDVRWN